MGIAAAAVLAGALAFPAWDGLKAPDPRAVAFLRERLPDLSADDVRELPAPAVEALLSSAAARGTTALEFFTGESLRGRSRYYLSRETLAVIGRDFSLRSLCPFSGRATDGRPFHMEALIVGGDRLEILYDRDGFSAIHPDYPQHGGKFSYRSRVTETIEGPGRLAVSGVTGPLGLRIRRLEAAGPGRVKVSLRFFSQVAPLRPISRLRP